jgi:hypothetical protein
MLVRRGQSEIDEEGDSSRRDTQETAGIASQDDESPSERKSAAGSVRRLGSRWSLFKKKPPSAAKTKNTQDTIAVKPPTEVELEKLATKFWQGEILIQGRPEKTFARMVWTNDERGKFHDKQCHQMLRQIGETMRKPNETVHYIQFMYTNVGGIISTESSLRDLITLQPPFITIIVNDYTKGSTVSLEWAKPFRKNR